MDNSISGFINRRLIELKCGFKWLSYDLPETPPVNTNTLEILLVKVKTLLVCVHTRCIGQT